VRPLRSSRPCVAVWSGAPERSAVITTAAATPKTTTQSTKGITPSRMVTPTDPDAHGASTHERERPDDGEAAAEARVDGARPESTPPDDARSPESQAVEPAAEPAPAEPEPEDTAPADTAPADTAREDAPAEPAPADSAPADTASPPSSPAEPAPAEAAPPATPRPVIPPPAAPAPRRRGGARRIVLGVAVLLLTAFLVGATLVPLPYYQFRPGSVRDTEPLIAVDGLDVYPSDGSISYTTVSLRRATLVGLVQGWIDDDIDIFDQDRVLQGRDVDENREVNLQLMSDSKQVATQVALERLGYDVDLTVGQVVVEVLPGTPAEGTLEVGDIITAIDGQPFDDAQDLSRLLGDDGPGTTITATVQPAGGGTDRPVELALAASPDDPARGVMGVRVMDVVLDYDFPADVSIDTGDVGGPSAGLAFTLALIDDLTPGELTGGEDVAVTGTISGDGTVGPVGGTGQKAAAVRDEGMSLFLVPSADYEAAVAHAGDDLEVVAVDTIDEALVALGERGGNVDDLPPVGETAAAPTG
jgi:PDZ domain-containing protein